jgi:hypothetical protein
VYLSDDLTSKSFLSNSISSASSSLIVAAAKSIYAVLVFVGRITEWEQNAQSGVIFLLNFPMSCWFMSRIYENYGHLAGLAGELASHS